LQTADSPLTITKHFKRDARHNLSLASHEERAEFIAVPPNKISPIHYTDFICWARPVAILSLAMAAIAFRGIPVAAAFFAAAFLIVVTVAIPLRDVYSYLDAPIPIMRAALIPVSDALRTTGTTEVIAGVLSHAASVLPHHGALALILVAAMAVTPFLNNAATVLVMAPIAATFAEKLGFAPDAFLMAVAIGTGRDFLTPIGHQCNTLVMGPGGYRFGDYGRLGCRSPCWSSSWLYRRSCWSGRLEGIFECQNQRRCPDRACLRGRCHPRNFIATMCHYHRAKIARMADWRDRLDRTTNWALTVAAEFSRSRSPRRAHITGYSSSPC